METIVTTQHAQPIRPRFTPRPANVAGYQQVNRCTDTRVAELIARLIEDPTANRKDLAADLGITRQTLYNWLARIAANQPVRGRGRRRKYGDEPSVALSVRVPACLMRRVLAQHNPPDGKSAGFLLRVLVESIVVDSIRNHTGELLVADSTEGSSSRAGSSSNDETTGLDQTPDSHRQIGLVCPDDPA